MDNGQYHPEPYWSKVGERIEAREKGKNVIAGDDEPYYRYKRQRFLDLLNTVDFSNKSVLEIGCGPGGNLLEVLKHEPQQLVGVDISNQMVKLARQKLPDNVEIIKIDGTRLPFEDNSFDCVFTATVLQHNTNEAMLKKILKEICRVSGKSVYLFERIESTILGDELCLGRPVDYYQALMNENNYELQSTQFINVRSSYYLSGAIRKVLNSNSREEGEPLNGVSIQLQKTLLPVTKVLDKVFTSKKDVCRLHFEKQ